ncbi:MAG: 3-hydroxyacyl-ACP dehydratase FabZ [Lentisphaerae bacterium]|nr:3-hydroxyacyl-ACP dehydratase FabZ [Lentisphaerota bacterium]
MPEFGIEEIMSILPHRYPFLFVDRVVACDDKTKITAIKNVTIDEPFFQGHFPGLPVMPGVLQLEAMAQTAAVLVGRSLKEAGGIPYFMSIDNAKFRNVVKPGDQLRIEIEVVRAKGKLIRCKGEIYVGDTLTSEAELMAMITDQKAKA